MADVELTIAGTNYTLACAEGEEERLRQLGAMVSEQVQAARAIGPGMSEARQLLFAALFLADQLDAQRSAAAETINGEARLASALDSYAQWVDRLSERVSALASRLDLPE